jgi:hypothetical protein
MLVWSLMLAGFFLVSPVGAEATVAQSFSADLSLPGTNGYLISVTGGHREVTVSVSEEELQPTHLLQTSYTGPGSASRDGIKADFGALGEISLRFVPSGKVIRRRRPKLPKDCEAPRWIVRQLGTFVGVMRFEGEAGYTAADATGISGSIGTPEAVLCVSFGDGSDGGKQRHLIPSPYLGVTTVGNKLGFAAAVMGSHRHRVSFVANSIEKNGAISILRWASATALRSAFKFDHRLTTATVTPPPPFSGAATFRRRRNGRPPSWTGSLAVSFLGALDVPLTGANFMGGILKRF